MSKTLGLPEKIREGAHLVFLDISGNSESFQRCRLVGCGKFGEPDRGLLPKHVDNFLSPRKNRERALFVFLELSGDSESC